MIRTALLTLAAFSSSAALAADDAVAGASAPATPAALLEAAVAKAKAHADDRFAYTLTMISDEDGEERTLAARFDPRSPAGARWTLLSPPQDSLDKETRKAVDAFTKSGVDDGPLLYDGLEDVIGAAKLVEDDGATAVFVAPVTDEDAPKDALEIRITLDKASAYLSTIEVRALKPFKPAPVAKVKSLIQRQTFSAPVDGGPALLASSVSEIEGEAMFKSFSEKSRQIYSDIEPVDAPPRDRKD